MLKVIGTNPNYYNNAEYIENKMGLYIQKEKWNKSIIERRIGEQQFQFIKEKEQKPIINKLDELIPLKKVDEGEIEEQKPIFNVNKKVISKSITPIVKEGNLKGKKCFYISFNIINWVVHPRSPDEVYLSKFDENILLTDDLKKVIEGNINLNDVNEDTLKNYIKLIKDSHGSATTEYVKDIKKILNGGKEGEGVTTEEPILYLPDNPCVLFEELSKLLASKKAGHNNVTNHIHAILKRLLELKLISTTKYEKIIDKYM